MKIKESITFRKAEKMMDKIIKKYGFESELTILFCETIEDYFKGLEDLEVVKSDFIFLMGLPKTKEK